jgi:hypothetical protein
MSYFNSFDPRMNRVIPILIQPLIEKEKTNVLSRKNSASRRKRENKQIT